MTKKTLVEICGSTWEVREIKYFDDEDQPNGTTDYDNQTIYLNKDLHPHRKGVTLVHELLHVIIDYSGVSFDDEEDVIQTLEHGIYELLQAYPKTYFNGEEE